MITINNFQYNSNIGKRSNNEDSISFDFDTSKNNNGTFVVCDGVGGNEKGEVASDLVSKIYIECLKETPLKDIDAQKVLEFSENKLTCKISENPDCKGMATTLTLTCLRDNGVYVAWCGDSRIYQIRDNSIIFKSIDHSWVNDAINSGILTPEEAIGHPKSNIITRAIQGSHKPTKVDFSIITDVKKGDWFFQCSDGVLESFSDNDLIDLFGESDEITIRDKLINTCKQISKDNFSFIFYRIEFSDIEGNDKNEDVFVNAIPVEEFEFNKSQETSPLNNFYNFCDQKIKIIERKIKVPAYVILIIITLFVFYIFKPKEKSLTKEMKKINKPPIENVDSNYSKTKKDLKEKVDKKVIPDMNK